MYLNQNTLREMSRSLALKMEQEQATIQVTYPWFFTHSSPISALPGLMHATIKQDTTYMDGISWSEVVSMAAIVTTHCPCSKEISEYSAHSQRGIVTIEIHPYNNKTYPTEFKNILIDIIESNASAKIYTI